MSVTSEKSEAVRLLKGLEEGHMNTADAGTLAGKLDSLLVYFVIRFLREKYPASREASAGVTERLLALTSTDEAVVKQARQGEEDPIREWFDDTYDIRDFYEKPNELMEMLVDKIES